MGGVQPAICCVGKEYEIDPGRPADLTVGCPRAETKEVRDVLDQLDELQQAVADLQGQMRRQREENDRILDAGDQLCAENERLREVVETMDTEKAWGTFDVLEAHYRHLEEHKRSMSETAGDATEAFSEELEKAEASTSAASKFGEEDADSEDSPRSLKSVLSSGNFRMPDRADEAAGSPFTTLTHVPSTDILEEKLGRNAH